MNNIRYKMQKSHLPRPDLELSLLTVQEFFQLCLLNRFCRVTETDVLYLIKAKILTKFRNLLKNIVIYFFKSL